MNFKKLILAILWCTALSGASPGFAQSALDEVMTDGPQLRVGRVAIAATARHEHGARDQHEQRYQYGRAESEHRHTSSHMPVAEPSVNIIVDGPAAGGRASIGAHSPADTLRLPARR